MVENVKFINFKGVRETRGPEFDEKIARVAGI